jgi:MerR family transcriptional regulator, thiopeptide resistance regulator
VRMKAPAPTYTVGEVARLAHVSVRALRHYDELGLLRPARREGSGYRLYTPEDLARLQQVLFYKELGFGLEEIRDLMSDPAYDRREALAGQRREIARRALRLEAMLTLIDKTLASLGGETQMNDEELFEVFGDFDPSEHADEARERWGETASYRESARRTKGYTREDWARFKAESDALNADVAALMSSGAPPDDPQAMDAAERHRLQIERWFYPCPPEMHVALGQMYVADPRFAATYDKIKPGMARYVRAAIAANAARTAGDKR